MPSPIAPQMLTITTAIRAFFVHSQQTEGCPSRFNK